MRQQKKLQRLRILFCAAVLSAACAVPAAAAAQEGPLLSVTEEAQILPIADGSGNYLLKSDGFYCLGSDGKTHNKQALHYFDHFEIDGTVLNGWYYHDESGKFAAGNTHVIHIQNLSATRLLEDGSQLAVIFDGYYAVNNLGRLDAAPQVRYLSGLTLNNQTFDGYYYFDSTGKLQTETGIHEVYMDCNGQSFDGYYYFGGENGRLLQEAGLTADGFMVDADGKLMDLDQLGMENLEIQLEAMIEDYEGEWSIYVKDLETEEEILINNQQLYSASLIKAFVMEKSFADMETIQENEANLLKAAPDSAATVQKVDDLLWNMITVSDNESFNELVRIQTDSHDFKDGAEDLNEYLEEAGYEDTSVQHTLAPSTSASEGLGGRNTTSVKDCGLLLERIYDGECVSEEASEEMLNLLLNQQVTWKIPQGLEDEVEVANKTGETDTDQHDIAIVYGDKTTYILCVMSENCKEDTAIYNIRDISRVTYHFLNLFEPLEPEETGDTK